AYANDYLGGINGHVIKVFNCYTGASAGAAADCSNRAIQANVSVGIQASGDDGTDNALVAGHIPVFLNVGATNAALGTPGIFSMANPLAVYGVPAAYAQQLGVKSATLFVIDVPGAAGPASQLGPLFFKNAGAALKVVAIPAGTPDMSPQVQTSLSSDPKLFYVLGDPTFCTSAIKAMKTLAPTVPISMYSTCIGPGTNIPGGYAGIKTVATQVLDPDDAEFKLYEAIQAKYDGAKSLAYGPFGYAPVLGLIRALNAAKLTDTSASGVLAAIKSAPAVPLPLGGGATFQCNGAAVSLSPNVCSSVGALADTDAKGNLTNFKPLGDASIYKK
ncbi:MAG: putative branched-chain amino acid transporter, amino acid-binding protein, partial [Pseudonocardiales bacterium]|nr:putative branched-chain amino acid transporter, amino acid-binding protein [Pseudonocardiales bacterium]